MNAYHLSSVPRWGAIIEHTVRLLCRRLFGSRKHWRARLAAWKANG